MAKCLFTFSFLPLPRIKRVEAAVERNYRWASHGFMGRTVTRADSREESRMLSSLNLVEFIADKIPAVDSAWDAVHTFIRIPAGAILAASAFANFDPKVRLAALLIGGGVAPSSHGMKAATRVAVNASPEPFSNIVVSLIEDAAAFGSTILMAFHPVLILAVVAIFVVISIWIVPRILRAMRRLFRRKSAAC